MLHCHRGKGGGGGGVQSVLFAGFHWSSGVFRQVISLPGPRPAQLTRRLVDFIWQGPELPNTGCCETCFNASCLGRGSPLDGGKIRDGGGVGGGGGGGGGGIPNATLSPSEVCVCVYGGGGVYFAL